MSDREQITTADIAAQQGQAQGTGGDVGQQDAPRDESHAGQQGMADTELGPLLGDEDGADFRRRWHEIQTGFVDEPRQSVERADALVAELMQRLAATFRDERESLEAQWSRGDDVSTEDLRVALRRYRSFFERLLST